MIIRPAPAGPDLGVGRSRIRTLAPYAPALLLFLWLCVEAFARRVDPDEAAYKIIDTGIVYGHWPYRDLFINRQPLTFLWYLPMGLGASITTERVLAAAMMAASVVVLMHLAARWLAPERAVPAGIAYALLLGNPLMPVLGNTEAFILLPLTGSFAVSSPFFAGALFGVAVMTKLHAAVFAPVLLLIWWRRLPRVALGGAAVVAVSVLPFVPIWHDFWVGNVTFALDYGHFTSSDRLAALTSAQWPLLYAMLPIWVAASIGAVRCRKPALLLWALGGVASVKASGFDFPHYYALAVPPIALLASEGIAYMHRSRVLRVVLVATTGWALLISGAAALGVLRPHDARPFEVVAEAAASKPGEMFVLGSRSDVYTYAGRTPQRRFFFSIPYVIREHWSEGVHADLLACPPDVLVVFTHDEQWPIPWQGDITALYGESEPHDAGTIYTQPRYSCPR